MTSPTREQFERMVREHHAAVHRAAMRLCGDPAAAADVAQDVFLRVLAGKEHLDAAVSERAALCWLATRLAANSRRAARRRSHYEEKAMRTESTSERDQALDPAAIAATADLHRQVQSCVDELPHELRVPLLLRCQDELTLAGIGTALRLSTSTVHDRIEAALGKLRDLLTRRGHALAAVALPRMVAGVDAAPAPLGLEARLLSLGRGGAPLAMGMGRRLAMVLLGGAMAVGLVVVAKPWGGDAGAPSSLAISAPGVAGSDVRDVLAQDPPVRTPAPSPSSAADTATGPLDAPPPVRTAATFTGVVRDADAWPVVGATISVVAGGGYKQFDVGGSTTTDAQGAFTITAHSTWLTLSAVRLVVREHQRQLLMTGDLAVPRPADARPLELVLPAKLGTATALYEFTVNVRDDAGMPLVGATASLLEGSEGQPSLLWTNGEATATSGVDGRAMLRGRGLGAKWLFVDGRSLHRTSHWRRLTLEPQGVREATVELATGHELTVVVTTVSGRELEWGAPTLRDEATGLAFAGERDGQGAYRFTGLGDGPFTVLAYGDGATSTASLRGVRPSVGRVTVRLKDVADEREIGDHMAELHGELVDAATGEVVSYGSFECEVKRLVAEGSSLPFDGIEAPPSQQLMMADGRWTRFHHDGLEAGRWVVVASVPGYALTGQVVELRANEVRVGLRIALHKQAVVRGRVLGVDGKPIPGASLFAVGVGPLADAHLEAWQQYRASEHDPGAPEPSFRPLSGYSGKDGTFVVDQLPPGVPLRLVVRKDAHGFVVVPLPALRAGEIVEGFDVRLPIR